MTPKTDMTLWHFFFEERHGQLNAQQGVADERVAELRHRIGGDLPVGLEASFRSSFDDGLKGVLSTSIADIVAGGWVHYRELRKARGKKKHPPEEVVLVPVGKHSISSSHRPRLELTVNGAPLPKGAIEFEVEFRLDVIGATLTVQGGAIREIRVGSCTGSGTLKYHNAVLAENKSRALRLPGVITFT